MWIEIFLLKHSLQQICVKTHRW